MSMSAVQYNMLYSVYSFPNIVFPLIGGYLMDKFGARALIYASSLLVTIGQAVFAFGVSINSFPIALLGRGIFGCGGENLDIAQSVIVITWFAGKELSMAFGLNSTLSLLGSVLNDNIEPMVVEKTDLDTGLWVGFLVCCASLLAAVFLNTLDRKRSKLLGIKEKTELPESERFRFRDVKEFSNLFWILLVNCIAVDTSVYCFGYIASGFYQERFGYDEVQSGSIMSITFFIAAVFCPLIGLMTDKLGKRVLLIIVSAISITLFHLCCLLTPSSYRPIYPIFYLVLLGLGYSIYVTVYWAAISYIVEPKLIGTAFGTTYAVSNFGLVIVPIFVGYLQDNTTKDHGYFWVSFTLGVMASVGIVTGFIVYFLDMKNGGILHSSDPVLALKKFKERKPNFEEMQNSSIN